MNKRTDYIQRPVLDGRAAINAAMIRNMIDPFRDEVDTWI